MKIIPILFSGPMVRANLDGLKDVTRRVVKPQPPTDVSKNIDHWCDTGALFKFGKIANSAEGKIIWPRQNFAGLIGGISIRHRFGEAGDLLWVRETWDHPQRLFTGFDSSGPAEGWGWDRKKETHYRADAWYPQGQCFVDHPTAPRSTVWRPSIHMPRWACRLVLRRVGPVRVERVEEITDAEAVREGFKDRAAFLHLFYDVNERAEKGSNPWVWHVPYEVAAKTHAEAQSLLTGKDPTQ